MTEVAATRKELKIVILGLSDKYNVVMFSIVMETINLPV